MLEEGEIMQKGERLPKEVAAVGSGYISADG
jgi:hypothetical protein